MFIKNAWYIAAEPDELSEGQLVSRMVLGTQLCVYRTASGKVAALEDRCPHRLAPLSLGKVVGESLQCLYHGAQFAADGECISIPGESQKPGAMYCATAFPVIEKNGYTWVWLGEKDKADGGASIPDSFTVSGDPAWIGGYGKMEDIQSGYLLINDNLFDITHAEFVHPESFGGQEVRYYRDAKPGKDFVDRGMTYDIQEREIVFRTSALSLEKAERGPLWSMVLGQSRGMEDWDDPIHFTMEVVWTAPCYTSFRIAVRPAGEPTVDPAEIINLHAAVPVTPKSSHYFYRSLRNYGDASMNEAFTEAGAAIFNQDKPVLEGQQRNVGDADLFDLDPKSFRGDKLQLQARNILKTLFASEAP